MRLSTRLLAYAVAAIAFVLSTALTVQFCHAVRPQEGLNAIVALGILWELAKLHFSIVSAQLWRDGRRVLSVCYGALVDVLVIGSVIASVSWLMAQRETMAASIPEDTSSLERQINTLLESADADMRINLRTRSLATMAQVDKLRSQKLEIDSRNLSASIATPKPDAVTVAVASLFGTSPSQAGMAASAIVAAMLELIAVAAYASAGTSGRTKTPHLRTPGTSKTGVLPITENAPELDLTTWLKSTAQNDDATELDMRIQAWLREPGSVVSYRAIKQRFKVGQSAASASLKRLHERGVLARDGNRYRLAASDLN